AIRAERSSFRAELCCANERALQRIRDKSENAMAQLGAVKTLEQIDAEETIRDGRGATVPGMIIVIEGAPPARVIDVTPTSFVPAPFAVPAPPEPAEPAASNDPIFRPRQW